MKKGLVSIVIVNWNGMKWLHGCFTSLHTQDYKQFEIIFVDNNSDDISCEWVKKHYPKTTIIQNSENVGFSNANNIGYQKTKGEYILFLNNDVKVTEAFLSELVKEMAEDASVGGAQSKILLMDKPDTLDSIGAFLTPTGFLYHYGFGQKDIKKFDRRICLYTAKGACMLFRKQVLDAVLVDGNVFDPSYFAYFEETDLCHRIWLSGYSIIYVHASVVFHKMGATSSSMNSAFIQYHSFKNRISSYLKNLGIKALLMIVPIHVFLCIGFALYSFLRGRLQFSWSIIKAILWNIRNCKKTLQMRRYIQAHIRIMSDELLFRKIMRYPRISYYVSFVRDRKL